MDNKLLVNNIRKICHEQSIPISKMEQDLFMSPGLISRWSKNIPTLDRIMDVANYLSVTLDTLTSSCSQSTKQDRTLSLLISSLYEQSINFDIDWDVLNPLHQPTDISPETIDFFSTQSDTDCFYCSKYEGYFFMTVRHLHSGESILSLYVLADASSTPELRCSDSDKLFQLYEYLNKRLARQLNAIKTDLFIHKVISTSSEPASESTTDKIKILSTSSSAKAM